MNDDVSKLNFLGKINYYCFKRFYVVLITIIELLLLLFGFIFKCLNCDFLSFFCNFLYGYVFAPYTFFAFILFLIKTFQPNLLLKEEFRQDEKR